MTREHEPDPPLADNDEAAPVFGDAEPTVWIVVDDDDLLETLSEALKALPAQAVPFATVQDLFQATGLDEPGCLLLDAGIQDLGIEEVRVCLDKLGPRPPVILLTDEHTMRTAAYGMKDGAFDLLEKPINPGRLRTAVQAALSHDRDVLDLQVRHDQHLHRLRSLSSREFQVMKRVVDGKSNKQVAGDLDISVKTVEAHRARVMEKMGVGSVPELVRVVLQCDTGPGLIDEGTETQ
jgi:two-component system response regulator TtrR